MSRKQLIRHLFLQYPGHNTGNPCSPLLEAPVRHHRNLTEIKLAVGVNQKLRQVGWDILHLFVNYDQFGLWTNDSDERLGDLRRYLTIQTLVTVSSMGIVDTLDTISGGGVAVSYSIGIDVEVTFASLTGCFLSGQLSSWISIVSICAGVAAVSGVAHWTLDAHHNVLVQLDAGAAIWTATRLAVIGSTC